jgi:hypothetical protein
LSAEVDGTPYEFDDDQYAHHYPGLGTTALGGMWFGEVSDPIASQAVDITFSGDAPGTYDCGEQSGYRMSYAQYKDGALIEYLSKAPCSIEVSAYGVVGQKLTGTFSATLGADGEPDVQLQNGSFDLTREPDSP